MTPQLSAAQLDVLGKLLSAPQGRRGVIGLFHPTVRALMSRGLAVFHGASGELQITEAGRQAFAIGRAEPPP